jgi:hypothetical protein
MRLWQWLLLGCILGAVSAPVGSRADVQWVFPLRIHWTDAERIELPRWIKREIQLANDAFTPVRIGFVLEERVDLASDADAIEAWDEAYGLMGARDRRRIDVFLVHGLPRTQGRTLGATIPSARGGPAIFVAESQRGSTLTNELGHYFGLEHSPIRGNLMDVRRTASTVPHLQPEQAAIVMRTARRFIEAREPALSGPLGTRPQ